MKKQGFTLAEVLITFGIIGIVAAVTLPGLNNGVNKSKVGPALAKAINTLETANRTALLEYNVVGIDDINANVDKMSAENSQECEKVGGDGEDANKCQKTKGNYLQKIALQLSGHTMLNADGTKNHYGFTLKDGTSFEMHPNHQTSAHDSGHTTGKTPDGKYRYVYYVVFIDINGIKKPNEPGQDIFAVYVDTAGTVIPAGSKEAERYFENVTTDADYHKEYDCKIESKKPLSTMSNRYAYCTGTIVRDGWQVLW